MPNDLDSKKQPPYFKMIYNDTSDRSGCHRKRAASVILMMTSSVMPWRRLIKDKREVIF